MTTDKDNKRVSDAYRELARETTPAALDERVLAMAARESRSRYGLARAWIRPVAWAAMIGISLAFMLEITWFTDVPQGDGAPQPAAAAERARQDAEVIKARQEDSLHEAAAEQADAQAVTAPASPGSAAMSPPVADEEPKRALVIEEASLPADVGQRARLQAVSERRETAVSKVATPDAERLCDSEARASAETWYACIRALRDQGLDDEAAAELEALLGAFPDFREPPPK
jgi:hypothetical protein